MYHKDAVVVVNRHDDCGVPPGVPETCVDTEFHPVPRTHAASQKGPLDGDHGANTSFNLSLLQRSRDVNCS